MADPEVNASSSPAPEGSVAPSGTTPSSAAPAPDSTPAPQPQKLPDAAGEAPSATNGSNGNGNGSGPHHDTSAPTIVGSSPVLNATPSAPSSPATTPPEKASSSASQTARVVYPASESGTRPLAPPPDTPFGDSSPAVEIDFPTGPSGPEQDKMVKSIYMPMPSGIMPRVMFGKSGVMPAPPQPVLVAQGLRKFFGKREVVRGVDLQVGMGEIVGLLGRNGAGKTTTFRMVMGLLQPDAGQVTYESRDITRLPMYQRANRGIGYLAQQPSIFQRMTVEENLLAILELQVKDKTKRMAELEHLVQSLGLQTVRKSQASVLSGGERRRLEIARAMSLRPRIILFDEPFAGIDPIAVSEIQGILRELKSKGVGVLLTDHNVRETLTITDRTYIMDEGQIWIHGPPREIVANAEARSRYLGQDFRLDF